MVAAHDPDGSTTTSASAKPSITRAAIDRASSQKPALNGGWPQQVSCDAKRTRWPRRSRMWTTLIPTRGKQTSTKQGMKSVTVIQDRGAYGKSSRLGRKCHLDGAAAGVFQCLRQAERTFWGYC